MADEGFIGKVGNRLSHDVLQTALAMGRLTTRKVADFTTKRAMEASSATTQIGAAGAATSLLAHGPGIAASLVIDGYINYREYKYEENRQRNFYEAEIAARLGKRPEAVTAEDMKTVAESNPVIDESIRRNKRTFYKNFITNGLSSILAVTAAVAVISAIPALAAAATVGGLLGAFAVGMAVSLPVFIGAEKVLDKVGTKLAGLSEPDQADVGRDPSLQSKLSVPGQMQYLANQQARHRPISQEQVMTMFISARPELGQEIEAQYGTKFADMAPEMKSVVLAQQGKRFNLEQLTDNINNRLVRVQELAFAVNDQASGVLPLESPHVGRIEKMQHTIDAMGAKLREQAMHLKDAVKNRLCFRKGEVSAAIPGSEIPAQSLPQEEPATKQWTDNVPKPPAPGMSNADREMARRAENDTRGAVYVGA